MGSEYRAEKDILANQLFDGRLEKFGVREHGQARENYRCLTDGESCLGGGSTTLVVSPGSKEHGTAFGAI